MDLKHHTAEAIAPYVENILSFCAMAAEERRGMFGLFVDKIPKYTASKIPVRLKFFEEVRAAAVDYDGVPAEDLEFFRAVAVHGLLNTDCSPMLTVACYGNCTDIRLFKKVRAMMGEKHRPVPCHRMGIDLQSKLPIKINDMLMCTDLGVIDPRPEFHNRDFIYPVNWKCCCVTTFPLHPSSLMWLETSISEQNGAPWFTVRPRDQNQDVAFSGATPDEPFAEVRARIMKRTGRYFPEFDGHEMFGLTSALFHRIVMELPGFEACVDYHKRFFRGAFQFVSKWPVIGQYTKEPEKQPIPHIVKFKYKKKVFGDLLPPLVVDFSPLLAEPSGLVIDVMGPGSELGDMARHYQKWGEQAEHPMPD
jgi:hypothetical protein